MIDERTTSHANSIQKLVQLTEKFRETKQDKSNF